MSVNLIDQEWSWEMGLWNYLLEGNYPRHWAKFFLSPDVQTELQTISTEIANEDTKKPIYPPINRVFRALSWPIQSIRVVIIGQDPYHNPGSATGLCFSVPPNQPINPSLQNIYTELAQEGYRPNRTGSLTHWAEQGCLMLNTALSVRQGQAGSHSEIWAGFTLKLLRFIAEETKQQSVAWLLMGADACAFRSCIVSPKHKAFITSHPSPLSAHKSFRHGPAFLGSNVFKQINEFLPQKISW